MLLSMFDIYIEKEYIYIVKENNWRMHMELKRTVISEERNWTTREEGRHIYPFVSFKFGTVYYIFKSKNYS